ncbi:hypothetical protein EG68_09664 [Paragonimus skrjabini miyazakii]|uniref:Uncharacterized protein n=1 Tax=Paragonimus skrjabini miyazakii TaxID=59628 RepID=A0A8S9YKK5_9TREM|nr:hypothetical protein EG68_09664 [Paragonimus skrjabini miyazakii]
MPQLPTNEIPLLMMDAFTIANQMREKLAKLDIHKAAGPDGIPPTLLKPIADFLVELLARLPSAVFERAELPQECRLAAITPTYMEGGRKDPEGYRLVGLTHVLLQSAESILRNKAAGHATKNWVLNA